MSEITECKACNPQCKKDCEECLKEFKEWERQQDITYSINLANANKD